MHRPTLMAVTLMATLALAACGDSAPSSDSASTSGAPAATPAQSPEATTVITHSDPAPHNADDTMFAQMMLVHHQGAVNMSRLAAERAQNPQVKKLAAQIEEAQGPEIERMTQWLQAWDEPVESGDHAHMHDDSMLMNGKTHEQVMTELGGLTGTAFDKAFLEAMIPHHEGAVTMSQDVLKTSQNPDVTALAQTIIDSQKTEIAQMKSMLDSL